MVNVELSEEACGYRIEKWRLACYVISMTAEDYSRFLHERRVMMAEKIKEYYNNL